MKGKFRNLVGIYRLNDNDKPTLVHHYSATTNRSQQMAVAIAAFKLSV